MNKEIKLNTFCWIFMIALILISFYVAESKIANIFFTVIILAGIKFITIAFQFIEVKHSHLVWKIVSILFITIYLAGSFWFL